MIFNLAATHTGIANSLWFFGGRRKGMCSVVE